MFALKKHLKKDKKYLYLMKNLFNETSLYIIYMFTKFTKKCHTQAMAFHKLYLFH